MMSEPRWRQPEEISSTTFHFVHLHALLTNPDGVCPRITKTSGPPGVAPQKPTRAKWCRGLGPSARSHFFELLLAAILDWGSEREYLVPYILLSDQPVSSPAVSDRSDPIRVVRLKITHQLILYVPNFKI